MGRKDNFEMASIPHIIMAYDTLLINAHRDHFGAVPGDVSIGINLLSRYLNKNGYRTAMFRGFAHEAVEWLNQTMQTYGALSIGFYCDYENVTLVAELSRMVKNRWQIPVFVGGPQAVGLDRDFFTESCCNVVVRGEGECTLLELMERYIRGGKCLSQIEGISYLDTEGNLVHCPDREPIENLDALPWPDFRLENGSGSWNMIPVITGRGCPFRCAFCYEGGNTKKVRYRSVRNVMDEVACHLERHPQCNYILFIDDTFTLDPDRVEKICIELTRLRRKRNFVWFCEGHVQTLFKRPTMLKTMAEAGLVKLVLGIESGSDNVLKLYRKKSTAEMVKTVVREAVAAQIPLISGNIIVGGPAESRETKRLNADFITRLLNIAPGRLDLSVFFLMPYPNTAITGRPRNYSLRLLLDRELHSMADIPLTETSELSWADLILAGRELNHVIQGTMKKLFSQGLVPIETVISNYHLAGTYGIVSKWLAEVFAIDAIAHNYYRLLAQKILSTSSGIPATKLKIWHPQRVFHVWRSLSFDDGVPAIGKRKLSPLEYELLVRCSGKSRLSDILDSVYGQFGEAFRDREAFDAAALQLLREFENRQWIAFSPI